MILSVRAFCVSFQFLSLLFFLWSRRLRCSLCCPLFLHLFPSFQLSLVNLSCLLCAVSFSVIPCLLRYFLRLRARSHIFSCELCSVLLSPSFQTFVGPVFSHIAPATLLSSISYYYKSQHLFTSFTVSKISIEKEKIEIDSTVLIFFLFRILFYCNDILLLCLFIEIEV